MIKLLETSSITNEIFNVGSGLSVSVTEIANLIKSLFGMEKLLPQTPELALVADIKKAKKLLNWFPQYSLQAGIQEIVSEKKND
jgi:nucleoside-diphosphate-sugar epimerase